MKFEERREGLEYRMLGQGGQSEAGEGQESACAGPGNGQSLRAGGFKQGIGIIIYVFYEDHCDSSVKDKSGGSKGVGETAQKVSQQPGQSDGLQSSSIDGAMG